MSEPRHVEARWQVGLSGHVLRGHGGTGVSKSAAGVESADLIHLTPAGGPVARIAARAELPRKTMRSFCPLPRTRSTPS